MRSHFWSNRTNQEYHMQGSINNHGNYFSFPFPVVWDVLVSLYNNGILILDYWPHLSLFHAEDFAVE